MYLIIYLNNMDKYPHLIRKINLYSTLEYSIVYKKLLNNNINKLIYYL